MTVTSRTLRSGFLESAKRLPARHALEVGGESLTYRELYRRAAEMAATLYDHAPADEPPLTAIFAHRSSVAFAGILAALLRGHGYVPLNRTFPIDRTRQMLLRAGCRTIIVDQASEAQINELMDGIRLQCLLIFPHRDDVGEIAQQLPDHIVLGAGDLSQANEFAPMPASPDDIAYLLFTSGSTGTPKGVTVAHRNVCRFIDVVADRYKVSEHDRLSQNFDMTFDLSVFDMFVAWERGACVCCPGEKSLLKPGRFIRESKLTIWFSVPSMGVFMKRLGVLKPDHYPDLRLSLFCGEALPIEVAKAWAVAAPRSVVENLYGPTELTIACTAYRWNPDTSPRECVHGVVPIGEPFPGMEAIIADGSLHEVEPGCDGELLMTGPQLTPGYWKDEEVSTRAFVVPPGRQATYYRTGDRVRRPLGSGPMVYLGRMDQQIKILGHRVELGEIEDVVRRVSGVDAVVALGWPQTVSGADGVEVFLEAGVLDTRKLRHELSLRLPAYMVPRRIHLQSNIPLNANGKYDRNALYKILESQL